LTSCDDQSFDKLCRDSDLSHLRWKLARFSTETPSVISLILKEKKRFSLRCEFQGFESNFQRGNIVDVSGVSDKSNAEGETGRVFPSTGHPDLLTSLRFAFSQLFTYKNTLKSSEPARV